MINTIFKLIPTIKNFHNCDCDVFKDLDQYIKNYYKKENNENIKIGQIKFKWPRLSQGNIDSYSFFALGEFILYSYYINNKDKYNKVFDIGANLGIDSIILGKIGYEVHAFEPDPRTVDKFKNIVEMNNLTKNITINNCGVSNRTCKDKLYGPPR